jgi:hypothetical protein
MNTDRLDDRTTTGVSRTGRPGTVRRRIASLLVAGAAGLVAMLGAAPSAWAGASFNAGPSIPLNVTVGQTGVQQSLVLTNSSFNGAGGDELRHR